MFVFSKPLLVVGLLVLAGLAGGARAADTESKPASPLVLATMANGEAVTLQDYAAYVMRRLDLRSLSRSYWGARQIIEEMVMTRALALEGERTGETKPERPEGVEAPRFDDLYGDKVYRKIAPACPAYMGAEQARQYYDEHPDAFTAPAEARLARIVLPYEEKVGDVSAADWLVSQARLIAAKSRSLDDVAKDAEPLYKLETQGDIGWVLLSDEVAIMRAISGGSVGDLLGPLREGNFVYLFKVLAKKPARLLPWDAVENSAPIRARQHCAEDAKKKTRALLFTQYKVHIDLNAIRDMFAPPATAATAAAAAPASSSAVEK